METGIVADLLSSDEMREALAVPRQVPRAVREYLAEVILNEFALGVDHISRDPARAAQRLGPLFHIFIAARYTEEWATLRQIASACPAMALICSCKALSALLDAFQEVAAKEPIAEGLDDMAAFIWLIRDTLVLWGREPGKIDMSARCPKTFDNPWLMGDLVQQTYVPHIRPFLDQMAESEDALEFLSLLYPGRMWDQGMAELHKEHLGDIRLYSGIAARSDELQQVLDIIGRTSEDEAPGNRAVSAQSRSELHSVAGSNDLQYILPSELVKLRDRTMKYLFLARWTEGNLLTYQLTGGADSRNGVQRRKGPLVAMVDTSGSMSGSPGLLAKALVLATAKRAMGGGRDMRVVLFSSTGQTETIDLSRHRKNAAEFLDFLRYTFGSGTDFNTALRSGLDALREDRYGGADLLFITDGLSKITDKQLLLEWNRFKADQDAQIFSVIVGNDNAGGLEGISDSTFVIDVGPGMSRGMRLTSR